MDRMLDAFKSQVIVLQSNNILEAICSLAASGNIHFPSKRGTECGQQEIILTFKGFSNLAMKKETENND